MIESPGGNPEAVHVLGLVPPVDCTSRLYPLSSAPSGSGDDVVICRGGGTMVIERVAVAVCCGVPESFTVTLALLVAATVGVPLITPVLALIDNPAGRPVADHVYDVTPPEATTVVLYATPLVPDGSGEAVVMVNCELMVIARFADAVCCGLPESFTVTFAVLVPAAVGVPLITPLLALIDNPAGRPVADHV